MFLLNILFYFSFSNLHDVVLSDCVEPSGIGDSASDLYTQDSLNLPDSIFFGLAIATDQLLDQPVAAGYEAAIEFRWFILESILVYNVHAAFEELPLDIFGRIEESSARRRCQPDANDADSVTLFELHRKVAMSYARFYWHYFWLSDGVSVSSGLMQNFGLDPYLCVGTSESDESCNDISTPWGLATIIAQELYEFSINDGWNEIGSYNRDYNKIPFSDFRDETSKYVPINTPWNLIYDTRWQPLLESDSLGFLYYQEHVVPHIGFTGKSYFFSDEELCEFQSYDPKYDYNYEIELSLQRLANLDDSQKMDIEFFDSKNNFFRLHGQFEGRRGNAPDTWIHHISRTLITFCLYEAAQVVWREKIYYDKVRPPSIVHKWLKGEEITSYAGTTPEGESYGTQTFLADDWEPYIRTMPHAEYPSASACVCEAIKAAFIEHYGSDNITAMIGGGLNRVSPAFTSRIEPLSTPTNNIVYQYNTWTQLFDRCGESRLEGGMHFTESVIAAKELCHDIGIKIAQRLNMLVEGTQPPFSADLKDSNIYQRDCPRNEQSSTSSSSDE